MNSKEQRVAELIRKAFDGVTLGEGVGLYQAQAIDDYASREQESEARERDEKEDWSLIPTKHLNECYSSLSFFDAEGMRFHLPAFMIAGLKRTFHHDVVFTLTYAGHNNFDSFRLLDNHQREAVREYLFLQRSDDFVTPLIDEALASYWKE